MELDNECQRLDVSVRSVAASVLGLESLEEVVPRAHDVQRGRLDLDGAPQGWV